MSTLSVAVVVATHNHARFLEAAVQSVLGQTMPPDDFVVVDDGSSDDTANVMARFAGQVRFLRIEHDGAATARNIGWRSCSTDLIAFLDADDQWMPTKLARQVAAFSREGNFGLVYCDTMRVRPDGRPIDRWSDHFPAVAGDAFLAMLECNRVQTSTVVMPRAVLTALDGFDRQYAAWEDVDLWIRVARRYEFCYVPEVLATYRMGSGLSTRMMAMALGELAAVSSATAENGVPMRVARRVRATANAHVAIAHYLDGDDRACRRWMQLAWRQEPRSLLRERTVATYFKSFVGRARVQAIGSWLNELVPHVAGRLGHRAHGTKQR